MSKNKFLALSLLGLVAVSTVYLTSNKKKALPAEDTSEEQMTVEEARETARRDNSIPSLSRKPQPLTIDQQSQIKAVQKKQWTEEQTEFSEKYFSRLMKTNKGAEKLYSNSLKYFGNSASGDGAARWVTLGLIVDSSKEYGQVLQQAQAQANQNPSQVFNQINGSLPELRKDPFAYQMTMNLIHNLDLQGSEKAQFYGGEFQAQSEQMSGSKPSDAFWISAMGLYLAQQSRVPASELKPFLDQALNSPRLPANIKSEMASTIGFYFPELRR